MRKLDPEPLALLLLYNTCVNICLRNSRIFSNKSLCASVLRQIRYVVDTGSPSGHIGRGPGAIRALWSAWQALLFIFCRREWRTLFAWLRYVREAFFCTHKPVKSRQVFVLPRAHRPDMYEVDNRQQAERAALQCCCPLASAGNTMRV